MVMEKTPPVFTHGLRQKIPLDELQQQHISTFLEVVMGQRPATLTPLHPGHFIHHGA